MTLEIRPITDEEVERAEFIRAYSFNTPDRARASATSNGIHDIAIVCDEAKSNGGEPRFDED